MGLRPLLFSIFICPHFHLYSQEHARLPRNFAGVSLVLDGTNISGTFGVGYERQLLQVNHFIAGVKADYLKRYKSGNIDLSIGSSATGFSNDYKISLSQIWGTAYLFLSEKKYSGFFLNTALGLTYSVAKKIDAGSYGNDRYRNLLPGVELGAGLQYPLDQQSDIRIMFNLSFSGAQDTPRGDESSLVLMGLKFSIGF